MNIAEEQCAERWVGMAMNRLQFDACVNRQMQRQCICETDTARRTGEVSFVRLKFHINVRSSNNLFLGQLQISTPAHMLNTGVC